MYILIVASTVDRDDDVDELYLYQKKQPRRRSASLCEWANDRTIPIWSFLRVCARAFCQKKKKRTSIKDSDSDDKLRHSHIHIN